MTVLNFVLRQYFSTFVCIAVIGLAQPVWAEMATRSPIEGIAVLDCDTANPSIKSACTLRIPPLHSRGEMRTSDRGSNGEFEFIRNNDSKFPAGLHVSATMLLIDETPGPGGMRQRYLARERKLIGELIDALPQDELVAVYAFNEAGTLHPLAEYTLSRKLARSAVEDFATAGLNTHIATNLRDAITLMAQRDDVLFRNIIVITDGEEEGVAVDGEVDRLAVEKGVVVSALGMFWRTEGSAQVGLAKDYLGSRLVTRDFGIFETVPLGTPEVASSRVAEFAQRYQRSIEQSGLIVPVDQPVATDLIVETEVPVVGAPGTTKTVEHMARFGARLPAEPPAETEAAEAAALEGTAHEGELWYGYPKQWYLYGAAGLGGLILFLLIVWLIARRRQLGGRSEPMDFLQDDGLVNLSPPPMSAPQMGAAPPVMIQAAPARPLVVLVREDSRERLVMDMPGGTIGRAPTNQIVLSDDGVSRIHSEIRMSGGAPTLSDAGSLNGTLLNGKPVKAPARIKTGDTIGLGNVTLRVTLP